MTLNQYVNVTVQKNQNLLKWFTYPEAYARIHPLLPDRKN